MKEGSAALLNWSTVAWRCFTAALPSRRRLPHRLDSHTCRAAQKGTVLFRHACLTLAIAPREQSQTCLGQQIQTLGVHGDDDLAANSTQTTGHVSDLEHPSDDRHRDSWPACLLSSPLCRWAPPRAPP